MNTATCLNFTDRYYNPVLGRFLSADPLYAEEIDERGGNSQEINLYAYVGNGPLSRMDPNGLDWVWSQETGNLGREDSTKNMSYDVHQGGYSGAPGHVNKPESEHIPNKGPIPKATYDIGPQKNVKTVSGKTLKGAMRLTPAKGAKTHGRGGFVVHGSNDYSKKESSKGCPILPPVIRNLIGNSDDKTFRVEQ